MNAQRTVSEYRVNRFDYNIQPKSGKGIMIDFDKQLNLFPEVIILMKNFANFVFRCLIHNVKGV